MIIFCLFTAVLNEGNILSTTKIMSLQISLSRLPHINISMLISNVTFTQVQERKDHKGAPYYVVGIRGDDASFTKQTAVGKNSSKKSSGKKNTGKKNFYRQTLPVSKKKANATPSKSGATREFAGRSKSRTIDVATNVARKHKHMSKEEIIAQKRAVRLARKQESELSYVPDTELRMADWKTKRKAGTTSEDLYEVEQMLEMDQRSFEDFVESWFEQQEAEEAKRRREEDEADDAAYYNQYTVQRYDSDGSCCNDGCLADGDFGTNSGDYSDDYSDF